MADCFNTTVYTACQVTKEVDLKESQKRVPRRLFEAGLHAHSSTVDSTLAKEERER